MAIAATLFVWSESKALMARYSQISLDEAIRNYVVRECIYRTYLNSIYINDGTGGGVFLVPRYAGGSPEEQSLLAGMERSVQRAYQAARPEAKVVWIDCDAIITQYGAIHCLTRAVPKLNGRIGSR